MKEDSGTRSETLNVESAGAVRSHPKPEYQENKKLRRWIARHRCYLCNGYDSIDETTGEPVVTPSHVIPVGMGRGRPQDEGNLIPMCLSSNCHQRFEDLSSAEKQRFLPVAQRFTDEFFGKSKYHSPHGSRSRRSFP